LQLPYYLVVYHPLAIHFHYLEIIKKNCVSLKTGVF